MEKKFELPADEIKSLAEGFGGCIATDMITVEGKPVEYMYRENPHNPQDSGWRFFSGFESQEYLDDVDNSAVYDINTIANYDPAIIPFLDAPIGAAFEKDEMGATFILIED